MPEFSERNRVELCGTVLHAPEFSHRTKEREFWKLPLSTARASGAFDILNLILPVRYDLCPGQRISVSGQLRSYNNKRPGESRLVLTVFALELAPGGPTDQNLVTLEGTLCKAPIYRRTPLGREICDILVAVARKYGRADYLPCILWGAAAREGACLTAGQSVKVVGRMQSRKYLKDCGVGSSERTAYEVSVSLLCLSEQTP